MGTEKVRSFPYRLARAGASLGASVLPAFVASHLSAPCTTRRYFLSAPGTAPKAAQQRVVVLRLLRLRLVSPQPPSSLTWPANHSKPPWISASASGPTPPGSRRRSARAVTAVAVDNALLAR